MLNGNLNKMKEIIMTKAEDVKGTKEDEIIYLIGNKEGEGKNTLYKNMEIIVADGSTGKITSIPLSNNEGYNPKLSIGSYKIKENKEILFISESSMENGSLSAEIFDFDGEKVVKIFSTDYFNNSNVFEVNYIDNYTVNIIDNRRNLLYKINLEFKGKKYLDEIYNKNGKLNKIIRGRVLPIENISLVKDILTDIIDIILIQKIVGINNSDIIGNINTLIKFNGSTFGEKDTEVSIMGERVSRDIDREKDYYNYDFTRLDFIESECVSNLRIERAIEKEFSLNPNKDKVKYLYNKISLSKNKDNILVYLEGPRFCSSNGCTLVILESKGNEYTILSKIENIINPIIVSDNNSNGYKDIIVRVLNNSKEELRILKYNGNSYPKDPIKEEKLKRGSKISGIAVISDDLFYRTGIEYK